MTDPASFALFQEELNRLVASFGDRAGGLKNTSCVEIKLVEGGK